VSGKLGALEQFGSCFATLNIDSLEKSRIGERHWPFRKKGFDTGGVKNSKLFEKRATSSWNWAAGVETPERGSGVSQFDFLRIPQ
jgi:hypothetical protein